MFLVCTNICTPGNKQDNVICVTLTTDQSDLKGLPSYKTVEFLSICLVHKLKIGVQTWGGCINFTPVLFAPIISSIRVFAIGY